MCGEGLHVQTGLVKLPSLSKGNRKKISAAFPNEKLAVPTYPDLGIFDLYSHPIQCGNFGNIYLILISI